MNKYKEYQVNTFDFSNVHMFNKNTDLSVYIPTGVETADINKCTHVNIGFGFDCETTNIDNEMCFVYIWQMSINKHTFLCRDVHLFQTFCDKLSDICFKQYGKKAVFDIYVANISYEYSFFKNYVNLTNVSAKTKRHIMTFDINNNLHFTEALGVYGSSLEKVAKTYCKTQKLKSDLNYDLIRHTTTPLTPLEKMYSINDVQILSELQEVTFSKFFRRGLKLPVTAVGIVRQDVKSKLDYNATKNECKKNSSYYANQDLYNLLRNYLYSGGLTHSLKSAVCEGVLNNITAYDLTSAYPWSIAVKDFPGGKMIATGIKNEKGLNCLKKYKHFIAKIAIETVTTKTGHSIISKHKILYSKNEIWDNGRLYMGKHVVLLVNEIDLQNILSIYHCDNIIVMACLTFTKSEKCPDFIKNTMLDYYKLKQVLKNEGKSDTKEYMEAKALVNSCYGMLVTQIYQSEIVFENGNVIEKPVLWEKSSKTIFNCFIGYWCTAYVRQRLIQVISKFPHDVVQYDTDSVYVKDNAKLHQYINKINAKIQEETNINISENYACCRDLGQWDIDSYTINGYKQFRCLGAKRYIGDYGIKHAHKTAWKKYNKAYSELSEVEKMNCRYKVTFAGANKTDMFKKCVKTKQNIFDFVTNFTVMDDESSKMSAKYFDTMQTKTVTDYLGNTETCNANSGTILFKAKFNASLSMEFFN